MGSSYDVTSNLVSTGTVTLTGPAPSPTYTISTAGANGPSGPVTSSGTWANTVFSIDDTLNNTSIHISGKEPKLKTDQTEIDLNELGKVVDTLKTVLDLEQIPIFDKAFRDRHEILQKSWEDVKTALENYRITEALLRSTPPGDDNDQ